MENRIAPTEERRLTRAIEKAATLASINDSLDRNKVLIDALQEEGVDKRFAKAASAAFNKRVTVLTFKKTADEHKAEPFALTDADLVYQGMGGEVNTKTASAAVGFDISLVAAPMQKAASAANKRPTRINYEEQVDYRTYQQHLESMIDKHAAAVSKLTGMLESLDSEIKEDSQRLADYFQKSACASFEFNTLINGYGDAFVTAMKDYLPATTDFSKTASAAILPHGGVYDQVADLLKKRAAYQDILAFFQDYSKGVAEFCKSAAKQSAMIERLEWANPLQKTAETAWIGNALRGTALTGMMLLNGAESVRKATNDAMHAGMTNAQSLYNAGGQRGMAPGDILDSEFLIKDRFRDRMMAWSDIAADPQFSVYPAEQVFQATHKAMDMDAALERPDRRELLRTQVGQLLAQNNRVSTADMAALATTLKALAASTPASATLAAAPIVEREKKTAPELPLLESVTNMEARDTSGTIDRLARGMETAVAEAQKKRDKEEAEEKEQEKEKKQIAETIDKGVSDAQREKDRKREQLETEARQQQLREEERQKRLADQQTMEAERAKNNAERDARIKAEKAQEQADRDANARNEQKAREWNGARTVVFKNLNIHYNPDTGEYTFEDANGKRVPIAESSVRAAIGRQIDMQNAMRATTENPRP